VHKGRVYQGAVERERGGMITNNGKRYTRKYVIFFCDDRRE
jgi:hypothetical protein